METNSTTFQTKQTVGTEFESWPAATWKRRLLAWYVDFLLFGAPWAVVVWALPQAIPALLLLSLPLTLGLFLILELLALRMLSNSPGHWLLGIRRLRPDPFTAPQEPRKARPVYLVDPWLKRNERWWTILFGVLAILNGAKTMTRWTMFTPAIPFFGYQLDDVNSAVVLISLGIAECVLGCFTLRLMPQLLPVGIGLYGITLTSAILSRDLWPEWIERYVTARRAYQGRPIREGEVEFMQSFILVFGIVFGAIFLVWLFLVAQRARRSLTQSPPQLPHIG